MRTVAALFFAGVATRIILGRFNVLLADEYELWWDPVGFACIVGMAILGVVHQVTSKRRERKAGDEKVGS